VRTPIFVTLGPSGTNHELITQRFMNFHGINGQLDLITDFFAGLEMIAQGSADYLVQAAVHPDCADVVAKAHFDYGIHVMDTFISSSKDLAILTRSSIEKPQTLALQKATRAYTDLSDWPKHIFVNSIMLVAEGLLQSKYDSGLTTLDIAETNPGYFRVDKFIGSVDDPWLILGRHRVANDEIVTWPQSPGVKIITGIN